MIIYYKIIYKKFLEQKPLNIFLNTFLDAFLYIYKNLNKRN